MGSTSTMPTRLYALGSNSSGQLGIGHHEDVDVPMPCLFIPAPSQYSNTSDNDPRETIELKKSYELKHNIRKIVAGGNHTLVLCDDGSVYAAGNREALGDVVDLGSQYPGLDEWNRQTLDSFFRRVMWWEDSNLIRTFTDISATWSASFFVVAPQIRNGFVVKPGSIYSCGRGERGELGLGKTVSEAKRPIRAADFGLIDYSPSAMDYGLGRVPLIPGILAGIWSSIACTVTCSTDDVHVFGWGSCRKGQLGDSVREEKVLWIPRKLVDEDIKQKTELDRISTAAVGRDFTLLFGTHGKKNDLIRKWILLSGNNFLRPDGDDVKAFLADLTNSAPALGISWAKTVHASWSNVYVLDGRTQRVKAVGRNDRGQLPPGDLPGLRAMAAGSEHCVGWTVHGSVLTWGWGEHGNCGRSSDEVGQGWSVLNLPTESAERINGVGAGCATTFIWTRDT